MSSSSKPPSIVLDITERLREREQRRAEEREGILEDLRRLRMGIKAALRIVDDTIINVERDGPRALRTSWLQGALHLVQFGTDRALMMVALRRAASARGLPPPPLACPSPPPPKPAG